MVVVAVTVPSRCRHWREAFELQYAPEPTRGHLVRSGGQHHNDAAGRLRELHASRRSECSGSWERGSSGFGSRR